MRDRLVIRRPRAAQDILDAVDYYFGEGGAPAASGFAAAIEKAFRHLGRYPSTGSERYASELGLQGLRCWPLSRYPFQIFYSEGKEHVDVWRILHGQRDIPSSLKDPEC